VQPTPRRWPEPIDWVLAISAAFWGVVAVVGDGPQWEKALRAGTALVCAVVIALRWRAQARPDKP
jgi:hypothetical protein